MASSQTTSSLRVIFAGTPEFAATHLEALLASSHEVVGILTQPDRPAGRGNKITKSPVKRLAETHQFPLFQPSSLKQDSVLEQIASLNADVMVVVAYGLIVPDRILSLPRLGCINVHGSLLPRWRGAAPIQRACLAGDLETGVTIMQMNSGLDTGDILNRACCKIHDDDTSASLYAKLAQIGPKALLHTLGAIATGTVIPEKQDDSQATYADKLSKEEAKLEWRKSAKELSRAIRAFNPWPICYFEMEGQPVKVWESHVIETETMHIPGTVVSADKHGIGIATGEGVLMMTLLQPAGKKILSAQELLNSRSQWFQVGHSLMGGNNNEKCD